MEIKNTPSPAQTQAFTGIRIKTSEMTDAQAKLSHKISDMLDYTDTYTKASDTVDVYMLPGTSEKSIVIKFMDKFSDMFFRKGDKAAKMSINAEKSDYNVSINKICDNLKKIESGDYNAPEMNVHKVLTGETDFAKVDPDTHEFFAEDFDRLDVYEDLYGKAGAKEEMVEEYNRTKRNSFNHPQLNFSEF